VALTCCARVALLETVEDVLARGVKFTDAFNLIPAEGHILPDWLEGIADIIAI